MTPASSDIAEQSKKLTSRFRTLALASLTGFALGALMELAYYKSGYYDKMQKTSNLKVKEALSLDENESTATSSSSSAITESEK